MSPVDWVVHHANQLDDGDAVTIDAVLIHMSALAHLLPRDMTGKFLHPVYVLLQKKSCDLYNITWMLEVLESHFHDQNIGMKIALSLYMGGNDFLPKFHGISHDRLLKVFMSSVVFTQNMFSVERDQDLICTKIKVNTEIYKDLMRCIYTHANLVLQSIHLSSCNICQLMRK